MNQILNLNAEYDLQNNSILICAKVCLCDVLESGHSGGLSREAERKISTLSVTHCGHLVLNIVQEERNDQSVIRNEAPWRMGKGEGDRHCIWLIRKEPPPPF